MHIITSKAESDAHLVELLRKHAADYNGRVYGELKILDIVDYDPANGYSAFVECLRCGNTSTVLLNNLLSGRTKTCGCSRRRDLRGLEMCGYRVLSYDSTKGRRAMWLCECIHCGDTRIISSDDLRRNRTSCKCQPRKKTKPAAPRTAASLKPSIKLLSLKNAAAANLFTLASEKLEETA